MNKTTLRATRNLSFGGTSLNDEHIFRKVPIDPLKIIGRNESPRGEQYYDPQATVRHFGLRGVTFGRMNDKERSEMLYGLAAGLSDLARVFGIPESAIGCSGRIALSIGSIGAPRAGAPCALTPWAVVKIGSGEKGVLAFEYVKAFDQLISHLSGAPAWISGGSSVRHSINPTLVHTAGESFAGLVERIFAGIYWAAANRPTKYSQQLRERQLNPSRATMFARIIEWFVIDRLESVNLFLAPRGPVGPRNLLYPPADLMEKIEPDVRTFLRRAFALCKEKPYHAEAGPSQQHFQFEGRHTAPAPIVAPMSPASTSVPPVVARETPVSVPLPVDGGGVPIVRGSVPIITWVPTRNLIILRTPQEISGYAQSPVPGKSWRALLSEYGWTSDCSGCPYTHRPGSNDAQAIDGVRRLFSGLVYFDYDRSAAENGARQIGWSGAIYYANDPTAKVASNDVWFPVEAADTPAPSTPAMPATKSMPKREGRTPRHPSVPLGPTDVPHRLTRDELDRLMPTEKKAELNAAYYRDLQNHVARFGSDSIVKQTSKGWIIDYRGHGHPTVFTTKREATEMVSRWLSAIQEREAAESKRGSVAPLPPSQEISPRARLFARIINESGDNGNGVHLFNLTLAYQEMLVLLALINEQHVPNSGDSDVPRWSFQYDGKAWTIARHGNQIQGSWLWVESNDEPTVETTALPEQPVTTATITPKELNAVYRRVKAGDITAAEFIEAWQRFLNSKAELRAFFNAKTMKELSFARLRSDDKKADLVQRAIDALEMRFVLAESFSWSPFSETHEQAVARIVAATTDEKIQAFAGKVVARNAEEAAREEALKNPQTYEDYSRLVSMKGSASLTREQRIRWEELQAERSRENRRIDQERNAVIRQADVDTEFRLIEGTHTKKGTKLFIVQLLSRVSPEQYKELATKAKRLGGHWSSFVKSQAGFHFPTLEAAQQFMALKEGDVSNIERMKERERQKELSASERLRELAASMIDRADEVLTQERKTNTWKRSQDAARVEGRAQTNKAMAATLLKIADVIEGGTAKYLDHIRFRSHVDTLDHILRMATIAALRADGKVGRSEDEWNRPPEFSDIEFAEYPYPWIHRDNLKQLALMGQKIPGAKLVSNRMLKYAMQHKGDGNWRVRFANESAIEDYDTFLSKLNQKDYNVMNAIQDESDYRHLQAMQIKTLPELRMALREYLALREAKQAPDIIKQAERALIGRKIPDYFPTPAPLVAEMLHEADIAPGMTILEPSAGKGDIAVAIQREYPRTTVIVIERDYDLRKILEQKGFTVVGQDFLEYSGTQYDRIIMNPPFSNEIAHVRHAYSLLKPGGRIVSIMSEGPFFRSDRAAQEFRTWIDTLGGTSTKLPPGSFKDGDVPTGVNTRLVVIDKPDDIKTTAPAVSLPRITPIATAPATLPPVFNRPIVYGRKTTLETVEGEVPAQYAVMDLNDVLASNNEHSFAPTVGYPYECQQRDYATSPAEKEKVIRQAADLKPSFLLTDDPSAGNGPPIVKLLHDIGITLGGNSRVMTLKRTSADQYAKYKAMLLEKIRTFGIPEQDVKSINRPVLVRVIDVEMARCATMSRVLNQNLTQAIDATQETIALARELTEEDTQKIATAFEQSGEETFSAAMARRNVADIIISVFEKHGIINRQNRPQWISSMGGLTSAGRDRVEETLLATILPTRKHIEYARSFTAKLLKTLPLMLRMQRMSAEWNLVPSIVKAIELESEFQSAGDASERAFETFIKSGSLTRQAPTDREVTVWKLLRGGIQRWQKFMASWVKNAEKASGVTEETSAFDFGEPSLTPEQLLAVAQKSVGMDAIGIGDDLRLLPRLGSDAENTIPLGAEWKWLGKLPWATVMAISGKPNSGASTLAAKLARALSAFGKVTYLVDGSGSEKVVPRTSDNVQAFSVQSVSPRQLREYVEGTDCQFVIVDAPHLVMSGANEILQMMKESPNTFFVITMSELNNGRLWQGRLELEGRASVVISTIWRVAYVTKSKFGGLGSGIIT